MLTTSVFELCLLTVLYWLLDRAVRRDGWQQLLSGPAPQAASTGLLTWSLPFLLLAPVCPWSIIPHDQAVRLICGGLAVMLTWKAVTKDVDPVVGTTHGPHRIALVICCGGVFMSPALVFVVLYLLTHPFRLWEHHATLPMRSLLASAAFLLAATVSHQAAGSAQRTLFATATPLMFFLVVMQVSHYWITAFAKAWLGPKWYSWVTDNQLHHLAASAYSWGWARFLPWTTWRNVIRVLRVTEKPMQLMGFGVELLAPLALLDVRLAIGFSVAWSLFHLGVFAVSGLLFWDWIVTDLIIAAALLTMPSSATAAAFGALPLLLGVVFMAVFPLRHRLWKPMPLGWWDTPLTQRMHWIAETDDGTQLGVYNNLMCPHERLYGKVHACFLAPKAGVSYHLGEVWKRDLRDKIRAAGPNAAAIDRIREQHGVIVRDEALAAAHLDYLRRFFFEMNQGTRKWILPRFLRWLKAPGDQIFYWGELPAYRGQQTIRKVHLVYREEYFDGNALIRLTEQHVATVDITAACGHICCRPEPTPKQIDDLLMAAAVGRIIDLPDFANGYTRGDDGKAAAATAG